MTADKIFTVERVGKMATAKNAKNVEVTKGTVVADVAVTPVVTEVADVPATVETPVATEVHVTPRRASVSGATFFALMTSGETANMTQAEAAAKLGMSKLSFSQRLNQYRKDIKHDIRVLTEQDATFDGAKAWEKAVPKFKADKRGGGRKGQKKEFSNQQSALMAFLKNS